MEEKIVETGAEMAEKVIEQTAENMDSDLLKYLGTFGLGVVVGITAYRKVMVPAWNWIQEKRKSKEILVKAKSETPTDEPDETDNSNEKAAEK